MPSTSELFAKALRDYSRGGGTPPSLTALESFDPTASLKTYGEAAYGDFNRNLQRNIGDLRGAAVGAGRLRTGFYDEDVGRLTTDLAGQYQRDLASHAMDAAGLKASTLGTATGYREDEQNRSLDLMSGQLDRETAERNARRAEKAAMWGGIGQVAGTVGAFALSGERFKTDIEPIESASERLERMPGVRFRYKGSQEPEVGVLAEDVDRELPEASLRDEAGRPTAVDYTKIVPFLMEATREQGAEIRQLRGELERLAAGGRLGEQRRAA